MKERLDETTIALRVAKELQDGWYVNLGFGIPTLAASFLPEGRTVFFQSENGLLGYGGTATLEEASGMGWLYVDAAAQPVFPAPGMAIFDYGEAFDMIRGNHLDLTVLGGLQVSERGDLANWRMPMYTGKAGTIGGAMDLAASARRVYVAMTHTEKGNKPKIVRECRAGVDREAMRPPDLHGPGSHRRDGEGVGPRGESPRLVGGGDPGADRTEADRGPRPQGYRTLGPVVHLWNYELKI